MNAPPNKAVPRRRRTPQRRVATILEERPPQKPLIFGWGAHLNRHEREAVKERIALFGGIALAAILVLLLGWGWYQDNVSKPAAARAANNKAVAQVGSYTIRMGYFKRLEKFRANTLNSQIQQVQQQMGGLDPKKDASLIGQYRSELNTLQQETSSLASTTLSEAIDDQTLLQRSATAGVPLTPQVRQTAIKKAQHEAGGPLHLQDFIKQSGMTTSEFDDLIVAENYLQPKLRAKLASKVSRYQVKVRASHILVLTSQRALGLKGHALAVKIYDLARRGADFAALAKKYSQDPTSAKKGGDLGYFARGQMVSQFDKAAFSMKGGEIRLVQSRYGYHIIKLTGRKKSRLSNVEFQQAKQGAYTNWLLQQQNLAPVRRFIDPSQLPSPNVPTPVIPGLSGQGLPSQQLPGQVTSGRPQTKLPQPVPQHVVPKSGKTGKQTQGSKNTKP